MEILCTLYEGHYHLGVAALVNSALRAGFKGEIWIGYRGETLPRWINGLTCFKEGFYRLIDDVSISFFKIETDMHFGYYKPNFLQEILLKSNATKVYYFDPDIIIEAPWEFFKTWVNCGVALCVDNCFPFVSKHHPWRSAWKELADYEGEVTIDHYVNSGFIGLKKTDIALTKKWIELTTRYKKLGGNLLTFEKQGFRSFKGDQDLLNATLTVMPNINTSIIGKEGMGFSQPAYLMLHAVDNIKPWKKKFLLLALNGRPPSASDKSYWSHSKGVLNNYSNFTINYKKACLRIASFIGRFYSKR